MTTLSQLPPMPPEHLDGHDPAEALELAVEVADWLVSAAAASPEAFHPLAPATPDATVTPRRVRSGRIVVAAVLLTILGMVLVWFALSHALGLRITAPPAKPASVQSALAQFRNSSTTTTAVTTAPPALTGTATSSVPNASPTTPAAASAASHTGKATSSAANTAAAPAAAPTAASPLVPVAGVYTYRSAPGSYAMGSLGMLQDRRPLFDTFPAVVTLQGNGCWTIRFLFFESSWDQISYCSSGPRELRSTDATNQKQSFVITTLTTTSCVPSATKYLAPDLQPQANWSVLCHSVTKAPIGTANATIAGPNLFVGAQTVRIGSTDVAAWYVEARRTASGDATGDSLERLWFAESNGMILRFGRHYHFDGTADYAEDSDITLVSLTPQQ